MYNTYTNTDTCMYMHNDFILHTTKSRFHLVHSSIILPLCALNDYDDGYICLVFHCSSFSQELFKYLPQQRCLLKESREKAAIPLEMKVGTATIVSRNREHSSARFD